MTKPLVYIAGPYSSNPEACTREACRVAGVLNRSGLVLAYCPHTSMLAEIISPIGYDRWLEIDLELVERSDALLRLPGESAGADLEVDAARALDMPVFTSANDVLTWARLERDEEMVDVSTFNNEPGSRWIPGGNVRELDDADRAWLDGLWNAYHGDLPGQRPKGDGW